MSTIQEKLDWFSDELQVVDPTASIVWVHGDSGHGRNEYTIATSGNVYTVTSGTLAGAQNGGVRLLYELGFRYFTPNPQWHSYPGALGSVTVAKTSPSYTSCRIALNYGHENNTVLESRFEWWTFILGMDQNTEPSGHSWSDIINRNKAAFAANPNMYHDPSHAALDIPDRRLNITDEGGDDTAGYLALIDLVKADRVAKLTESRQTNDLAYMVSLDPKDSNPNTTDEVVAFVNEIAPALAEIDGWVSIYGYANHSWPPTIECAPNLFVQVALAYNFTNLTTDELLAGWADKVTRIGLREYWGVHEWSDGHPTHRARLMQIDRSADVYPRYYSDYDCDVLNSETIAYWVGQSFGFYVAWHMLKDVNSDFTQTKANFFSECFNDNESIKDLFTYWNTDPPISSFFFRNSFDYIDAAIQSETDEAVLLRIHDLRLYMFMQNERRIMDSQSTADPYGPYFTQLENYMSRLWTYREDDIVHYYAAARRLCNAIVKNAGRNDLVFNNPNATFKRINPITDEQYATMRTALEDEVDFTEYSDQLVVVNPPGLTGTSVDQPARYVSGTIRLFCTAGTIISVTGPADVDGVSVASEVISEFTIDTNRIVTLSGATYLIQVLSGVAAIKATPEYAPSIAYDVNRLWGYCDKLTMQAGSNIRMRIAALISGSTTTIDFEPSNHDEGKPYRTATVQKGAYAVHASQSKGLHRIYDNPPWLSFYRHKMVIPKEVADADSLSYTEVINLSGEEPNEAEPPELTEADSTVTSIGLSVPMSVSLSCTVALSSSSLLYVLPQVVIEPEITGDAVPGRILTCSVGLWFGYPRPVYVYRWYRDGQQILGEHEPFYAVLPDDTTKDITCEVEAVNLAGSAFAESNTITIINALLTRAGFVITDRNNNPITVRV